jgi:hypothetical protein
MDTEEPKIGKYVFALERKEASQNMKINISKML